MTVTRCPEDTDLARLKMYKSYMENMTMSDIIAKFFTFEHWKKNFETITRY